jgi:hypothetical protein
MDDDLKFALQLDALAMRSNMNDTIVRLLSERFGVAVETLPSPRRSPFGGGARRHRRPLETR